MYGTTQENTMNLSNPTRFTQVLMALLVVNASVLLWLNQLPSPAVLAQADLSLNIIRGSHQSSLPEVDFTPDIEVLDRILAQRVSMEAGRRGVDPEVVLPPAALREAALTSGEIQGPQTRALVAAYQATLERMGVGEQP